jgi:hypothetical protein
MKGRDVVQAVKDWWDRIPGWHERIIWTAGGAVLGAIVARLL